MSCKEPCITLHFIYSGLCPPIIPDRTGITEIKRFPQCMSPVRHGDIVLLIKLLINTLQCITGRGEDVHHRESHRGPKRQKMIGRVLSVALFGVRIGSLIPLFISSCHKCKTYPLAWLLGSLNYRSYPLPNVTSYGEWRGRTYTGRPWMFGSSPRIVLRL